MKILFVVPLSLLCMSICACDDLMDAVIDRGFEMMIRSLRKQEEEKAGKKQEEEQMPADQITFQETEYQFDNALKEKNIALAETLEQRLALFGHIDWEYLNGEKQRECSGRLKDAAKNLSKQGGTPIVDYQEEEFVFYSNEKTFEVACWLKDQIIAKRCQNLKWSEIVTHLDERFECLIPRGEWEYEDFKVTEKINACRIKKLDEIIGVKEVATQTHIEDIPRDSH